MGDTLVQEIIKVFGITKEDAIEFLDVMESSEEKELPKDFFEKIPDARIVKGKVSSENEIHFNESHVMGGQFGTIMFNKDKPHYIYKVQRISYPPQHKDFPITVKQILQEALLNVILQTLPESKPYTCKIYKVVKLYKPGSFPSYDIIFKLENLKGRSVKDTLIPRFPFLEEKTPRSDEDNNGGVNYSNVRSATDKEKQANKRLLVKIMAPLYKVIQTLREKYEFFHGDMHTDNLMFIDDPIKDDGSFDESKLAIKMIDFAFSTIQVEGKRYGYYDGRYRFLHKEVSIFRYLSDAGQLPEDIQDQVAFLLEYTSSENLLKHVKNFEWFIIDEDKAMTGGRHKKTRKQRRKKRRVTRK